jgi:hypothetical protein
MAPETILLCTNATSSLNASFLLNNCKTIYFKGYIMQKKVKKSQVNFNLSFS